jgi:hypothetical protein
LIVCHNRGRRVENHKFKNRDHQKLREDAILQDPPGDCISINRGQDISKNIDKGKVVDGNREGNSHDVNKLAGSGNANDGEEDVPKDNVVQEFISSASADPRLCNRNYPNYGNLISGFAV